MAQDEHVIAEAHRWVDTLERKWRLQILSTRYRVDPATGERVEMPLRIRRFAEGIPYACVDEALRYLLSLAPYRDVVYNGMLVDGEYVPTVTTWMRDDKETVNGISRTDGTYTIVQDLVDSSVVDRYMAGTSRSCTEEVTSEWVWDSPAIGEIPEANPLQGVTYAVQSVSRNEDGTFNYALVKRVALMQHTERVLTRVTADESVSVETWDNLYGSPGVGFRDGPAGDEVPVPAASYDPETGVRVEVQVTQNADCTYKVQAVTTEGGSESGPVYAGGVSCAEDTSYEYRWHDSEVADLSARRGTGKTVAIQNFRREDDGTFTYVIVTRTAKTQDSGDVVQSSSAVETVVVRTIENAYPGSGPDLWVTDSGVPLDVPAAGVHPEDGRIEVQLTQKDDCTYRIQVTKTRTRAACPVERQTGGTVFESQLTVKCAGQDASESDAPPPDGGVMETRESQLQPDGTYVNTVTTKQEQPVPQSSVTVSVGRKGRRVTVVDTNMPDPAEYSESDVGIGGSVRVEVTPGGLYTNTVTTFDLSNPVKSGDFCTEDVFHHQHDTTRSGVEMPSESDHVQDSGQDGLVISRRTDMDDDGAVLQTVSKNQEKLAPRAEETWQVGPHGVVHTVKHRNVSPDDREHFYSESDYTRFSRDRIGSMLRREETPGGWYDVTVANAERIPDIRSGVGCSKTVFLHTDTVVKSAERLPDDSDSDAHVRDAGLEERPGSWTGARGVYRSSDVKVNADGTVTSTVTENVEIPVARAQLQDVLTDFEHKHVEVDKNFGAPHDGTSLSMAGNVITTRTSTMNPGGSFDVTTETRTPYFRWWKHLVDTNWRWSLKVWFRNATRSDVEMLYAHAADVFSRLMDGSESCFINADGAFSDCD